MYGCTLPTVKKLEDVGAVTDIITVAYNVGYSDAKTQNNRLTEIEKIVVDGYNTPGEYQDWLVDSIRKAYKIGYEERSKEKRSLLFVQQLYALRLFYVLPLS